MTRSVLGVYIAVVEAGFFVLFTLPVEARIGMVPRAAGASADGAR